MRSSVDSFVVKTMIRFSMCQSGISVRMGFRGHIDWDEVNTNSAVTTDEQAASAWIYLEAGE